MEKFFKVAGIRQDIFCRSEQSFVEKGQSDNFCKKKLLIRMRCRSAKASKLDCKNWSSSEYNNNNAWNFNFNNGNTNNNDKNNTNYVRAVRDSSTKQF
jgi:hypothetical protein